MDISELVSRGSKQGSPILRDEGNGSAASHALWDAWRNELTEEQRDKLRVEFPLWRALKVYRLMAVPEITAKAAHYWKACK